MFLNLETLRKAKLDTQRRSDAIKEQGIKQLDGTVDAIVRRAEITQKDVREFIDNPGDNSEFVNGIFGATTTAFKNVIGEVANNTEYVAKDIVFDRRDKIQSGLRIVTQEIIDKVKPINVTLKKSGFPTITLPSFPVSVSINVSVEKLNPALIDFEKIFNFDTNSSRKSNVRAFLVGLRTYLLRKTLSTLMNLNGILPPKSKGSVMPNLNVNATNC